MRDYHEKILNRSDVELIHISADHTQKEAEQWAQSENFPWPTVLPDQISPELAKRLTNTVPSYRLYNANGELMASGRKEALAKIAEKE